MMSQTLYQDMAAIFFISRVLTGNKAAAAPFDYTVVTFSHPDLS